MILLLSVRLLDDRFHGLTANGEKPEWPPSSFRLFQAIVAGNAQGETIPREVVNALQWLETLEPPEIIAPNTQTGRVLLTYVLNNSEERSRTQKFIRPTLLNGDRLIEFAWRYDPKNANSQGHPETLVRAVRHIRAFGWGIDLAIGHGDVTTRLPEKSKLRIHFYPSEDVDTIGIDIRSPRPGSLASLRECYAQFLGRFESNESTVLESGGPIYQLRAYMTEKARPHAVFKLVDENDDAYRYPHAKLIHIAGMTRHLAIERMTADPPPSDLIKNSADWINRVVRGKRDASSAEAHRQFSYIPLPSIGHDHADAMIRNVMIVAPPEMEPELDYLVERLDGETLNPENDQPESRPQFSRRVELQKFDPPSGKFVDTRYLGSSRVWQTVTPVILPGHDDKKAEKTVRLIQAALQQSGIEWPCEFMWQSVPFLKNCLSAHKYDRDGRHTGYHRPSHLKDLTAVHVRLEFTHSIPGPLAIGAGRHCGLGVFAAVKEREP